MYKLPEMWWWFPEIDDRLDILISELRGDAEVLPYSKDWEVAKTLIPKLPKGTVGPRLILIDDANGMWTATLLSGTLAEELSWLTLSKFPRTYMGNTPMLALCRAWIVWQIELGNAK